mmetsp:Transcript_4287/g.9311  ORF Transcript_4287/g.9311 Transcript_4287/m.9311 type:complete len:378 (+) Transcript_4287:138-1271(+)
MNISSIRIGNLVTRCTGRALGGPQVAWLPQSPRNQSDVRRRTCNRTEAARSAESDVSGSSTVSAAVTELSDWLNESGGFVHPALAVVEQAPCGGGRGVICTVDQSEEDVAGMPLVLVPEELLLTSEVARYGFGAHYEPKGAPPLAELDQATQLAIMLAHERVEGPDSFYHPYIQALPERAPCAWSMEPAQLRQALQRVEAQLGGAEAVQVWVAEVERYRRAMQSHAEGAEERYKKYFPLTADDFFWAMGQVLSRSFASHPQLALIPFIDLLNHQAGADHPELVTVGGDEGDRCMCISSVSSSGTWQPLSAGQELFIRYFDHQPQQPVSTEGGSSGNKGVVSAGAVVPSGGGVLLPNRPALDAFLSYGYVPPELWLAS